jgi:hypothetical protein
VTTSDIPCRCCGVATDQRVTWHYPVLRSGLPGRQYEVGVCDDCVSLRPDEPGSAVRAALRILGRPESEDGIATGTFLDAGLDVSTLLYVGATPQKRPWGHVSTAAKADLKRAYLRVLDTRVHAVSDDADRPVRPHAPPVGYPPACLACGVGTSAQWHGPITTGALTKPDMVTGVVCDVCAPHLLAAGAVGAPFLERAAMEAKGFEWVEGVRLPRLQAWVTLHRSEGLPPQAVPWSWVELRAPEPEIDPMVALRVAVRELTDRVAALEAGACS